MRSRTEVRATAWRATATRAWYATATRACIVRAGTRNGARWVQNRLSGEPAGAQGTGNSVADLRRCEPRAKYRITQRKQVELRGCGREFAQLDVKALMHPRTANLPRALYPNLCLCGGWGAHLKREERGVHKMDKCCLQLGPQPRRQMHKLRPQRVWSRVLSTMLSTSVVQVKGQSSATGRAAVAFDECIPRTVQFICDAANTNRQTCGRFLWKQSWAQSTGKSGLQESCVDRRTGHMKVY